MITADGARRVAAVLFLVTGALFVVGVVVEGDTHTEPAAEQPVAESGEAHVEGAEEPGNEAEADSSAPGAEAGHDESSDGETVLGIDAESPATVTLAVLASIALAAGLWFTKRRAVAVAAVVVGTLFALFDIAEVIHQLDESRTGLAVLAAVIAVGHAAAAALAGRSAVLRPS